MFRNLTVVAAFLAGLVAACKDTPVSLDNPVDPSAARYVEPLAARSTILVDDFDDGNTQRNILGYCQETFRDPNNLASITATHVSDGAFRGQSLRIDFNVSVPGDPFGGYVEVLTGNDLCPSLDGLFNAAVLRVEFLTFWIKSSSTRVDVEVAIKDIDNVQTDPKRLTRTFAPLSTTWHKVRIPMTELLSGTAGRRVDHQRLREISFGFARRRFLDEGLETQGSVYIDELAFER